MPQQILQVPAELSGTALRQPDLALAAGVGIRFIVDLEVGKARVQLDRVLLVLEALGARLMMQPPTMGPLQGSASIHVTTTGTLTDAADREKEGDGD